MSLDVYLESDAPTKRPPSSGIFIREDGSTVEISREEWDRRNYGREPVTFMRESDEETTEVYHANITHNLGEMANAAGIYYHLWMPEECGCKKASDLIGPLRHGLALLKGAPERFEVFNPANGWGKYEDLVRFVEDYVAACEANPTATVRVDR